MTKQENKSFLQIKKKQQDTNMNLPVIVVDVPKHAFFTWNSERRELPRYQCSSSLARTLYHELYGCDARYALERASIEQEGGPIYTRPQGFVVLWFPTAFTPALNTLIPCTNSDYCAAAQQCIDQTTYEVSSIEEEDIGVMGRSTWAKVQLEVRSPDLFTGRRKPVKTYTIRTEPNVQCVLLGFSQSHGIIYPNEFIDWGQWKGPSTPTQIALQPLREEPSMVAGGNGNSSEDEKNEDHVSYVARCMLDVDICAIIEVEHRAIRRLRKTVSKNLVKQKRLVKKLHKLEDKDAPDGMYERMAAAWATKDAKQSLDSFMHLETYSDVFKYDRQCAANVGSNRKRAIALFADAAYVGHVWVWPSSAEELQMIGIRTSAENYVTKHHRGIGSKIIAGVLGYAKKHKFKSVRVISPIGPMPQILTNAGFTPDEKTRDMLADVHALDGDPNVSVDLSRCPDKPVNYNNFYEQ
jgi:hypothetical protein